MHEWKRVGMFIYHLYPAAFLGKEKKKTIAIGSDPGS